MLTENILRQSREAESALADALVSLAKIQLLKVLLPLQFPCRDYPIFTNFQLKPSKTHMHDLLLNKYWNMEQMWQQTY